MAQYRMSQGYRTSRHLRVDDRRLTLYPCCRNQALASRTAMTQTPRQTRLTPAALQQYYKNFKVTERILLSGHSHQAWPDVSLQGVQEAWHDAAELVDGKWAKAAAKAARVQRALAMWLDDDCGEYTLGTNTHQLLLHWFSALPNWKAQRIVTTDGEFHSMRRQFNRLEEEGWQIVRIPQSPALSVGIGYFRKVQHAPGQRLAEAVTPDTSAVLTSACFFMTGRLAGGVQNPAHAYMKHFKCILLSSACCVQDYETLLCTGLRDLAASCRHDNVPLLIDSYHMLGNMRLSLRDHDLEDAFVVGGGYKYLQLGEGNCFLRYPKACAWRPVFTGWFADFEALEDVVSKEVRYHSDNGQLFASATPEPVSHYRAAAVMDFFEEQGMTPEALRELYQHQLGVLRQELQAAGLTDGIVQHDCTVPLEQLGAFLTLTTPHAGTLKAQLLEQGVFTDYRGDTLRLGPAPYVTDDQLKKAVSILQNLVQKL